jgi:hypothetical protein
MNRVKVYPKKRIYIDSSVECPEQRKEGPIGSTKPYGGRHLLLIIAMTYFQVSGRRYVVLCRTDYCSEKVVEQSYGDFGQAVI